MTEEQTASVAAALSKSSIETDVLVVGSGGGGLTCAVVARQSGRDVLVVEKTRYFGGATAVSGGGIWIPGNHLGKQAGIKDSREAAARYLQQLVGPEIRQELLDAYLEHGPRMFAYLQERTAVAFDLQPHEPDYYQEVEGAAMDGRLLSPIEYDGRALGEFLTLIRPPLKEFNAPAGFMIGMADLPHLLNATKSFGSFWHLAKLALRYGVDRLSYPRGTRLTMGNALIARLLLSAQKAGVQLWRNAALVDLVQEQGRVTGAIVERDGQRVLVKTRRGVVLASGGFSADPELRKQYIPYAEHHVSFLPDGNTGDGLRSAMKLGATLPTNNVRNAAWTVMSVARKPDGTLSKYPHVFLDRPKPGCMAVNSAGKRFVNEAAAKFVDAMHATGSVPAHLICDRRFIKKYGLGLVYPGGFGLKRLLKSGYVLEAPTLSKLAEVIGADARGLEQTVATFNEHARKGQDPEFGKGANEVDRSMGDAAHRPNPCLAPLETGPFYAVKIFPGDGSTTLGLPVDAHARVLGAAGQPIPGLYACGLDMNSAWRGVEPAHGSYNGLSMTFGFIAAQHLAS